MNSLTSRLAGRLSALRRDQGWSLDHLAAQSGVSRATLSRLENASVSPTAEVLGKLCATYGLPMSRLLLMVEDGFAAHVPFAEQQEWQDPDTGFTRRSVSPPANQLRAEVLECHLISGEFDYLLRVAARNTEDYEKLYRERLTSIPSFAQMKTLLSLSTVKEFRGFHLG